MPMASVDDGFCFLTGMKGSFRGAGEEIRIAVADGRWMLQGSSMQQFVEARARCVAYFQAEPPPAPNLPIPPLQAPTNVSAARFSSGAAVVSWAYPHPSLNIDAFWIQHRLGIAPLLDEGSSPWKPFPLPFGQVPATSRNVAVPDDCGADCLSDLSGTSLHHIFRVCAVRPQEGPIGSVPMVPVEQICSTPIAAHGLTATNCNWCASASSGGKKKASPFGDDPGQSFPFVRITTHLAGIDYSTDDGKTWQHYKGPLDSKPRTASFKIGLKTKKTVRMSIPKEAVPKGANRWRLVFERRRS